MAELLNDATQELNAGDFTSRSPSRLSSEVSQFQSSTTRSTISSAASTSDTINSNEEVHNYEDWELVCETADGSKAISNMDGELETSADYSSWSSRRSPRSEEERADSTGDDVDDNYGEQVPATETQISSSRRCTGQRLQDDPETCQDLEDSKNEIDSARSDGSNSTSSSWTDEPQVSEDPDAQGQFVTSRSEAELSGDLAMPSQSAVVADRSTDVKVELLDPQRPRERSVKSVQRNIQVFVRVRPLPVRHNETRDEATQVVKLGDGNNTIRVQAPVSHGVNCAVTECSFDKVFMGGSTQEEVFSAVQPSIRASLDGYNATIFAYGQTGTGKTHTIFGDEANINFLAESSEESERLSSSTKSLWGIIPRAMALLLHQAEQLSSMDVTVDLQCSFMQIYNDRLFDLLTDRRRQRPLIIREQPALEGGTNVLLQGLSSERIATLDEAMEVLRRGRANRSVRETELNSCSSRSHAIVQINITSERTLENGDKLLRKSRLNLVDLAGSEKWNTDLEMEDAHSQELKNINTSLSALGNCIAALSEAGRRHIPYRDSTLTRLLQDSFGGNTQACLIATISPALRACEESVRTLQFADRARSVMQSVRVNEALSGVSELQIAKAQISKLRDRLESEQRRRHQTRVKEQEAAQKEFLDKLQVKEKEIQKLSRDNAVYSRWREEDLRKIRELESRVKGLEVVAHRDVNMVGNDGTIEAGKPVCSAPRAQHLQAPTNDHDEKENLLKLSGKNDAAEPQAVIKKTKSKKSISTGCSAMRKDDIAAVKPYRQILERYALGSKKSSRGQPERRTNEMKTPPPTFVRRPVQQEGNQSHSQVSVVANDNNQRRREKDNQDAAPGLSGRIKMVSAVTNHQAFDLQTERKDQGLHEGERMKDMVFGSPQRVVSNNNGIGSVTASSPWKSDPESSVSTSVSKKRENSSILVSSNWRSQTNLFEQTYRSYLQPAPSTSAYPELAAVKNDKYAETGSPYQRSSEPVITGVPDSEKSIKSSTVKDLSTYPPYPTISIAVGSSNSCEKHSLKGCVLCVARDPRSQTTLPNKSSLSTMANTSTELPLGMAHTKPVAEVAHGGPCDRHSLASCFICGSSSGTTQLSQSAVESKLSSISNPLQQISSRYEEIKSDGAAAKRNPLLMNDSKCDAHSLANCVLCAGVKAMSRKIQQGSPKKAFQSDSSSSPANSAGAARTSNRSLPIAAPWGDDSITSSNLRAEEQLSASPFGSKMQPHPLLRRHSVEYGSPCEPEGSTSPVKLQAHLRPQQSAANLHSNTTDFSSSFTSSPLLNQSRISGGALETTSVFPGQLPYLNNGAAGGNTLIQSTSPTKSSWQPAARPSIKELAGDSNRKSYHALIREASDAAAFVLRRK